MRPRIWSRRQSFSAPAAALPAIVVALALAALIGWLDHAPPVAGRAQAIDGDTLRIGDRRIRLTGLDAPELEQSCLDPTGREWACGTAARTYLAGLIEGSRVSCSPSGRDVYGRTLGSCAVADEDLGGRIVGSGWAVADFAYFGEEGAARTARLGIWSGEFIVPARWRRAHREASLGPWEWIRSWFQ